MVNLYPVFPIALLQRKGHGQGATVRLEAGTTKCWRGFFEKNETRLVPGVVQLYSLVVYRSKYDMYTDRWQIININFYLSNVYILELYGGSKYSN